MEHCRPLRLEVPEVGIPVVDHADVNCAHPVDVDVNGFLGAALSYYPFMRRKSDSRQVINHYDYHPGTGTLRCKLGMRWKVRFRYLQWQRKRPVPPSQAANRKVEAVGRVGKFRSEPSATTNQHNMPIKPHDQKIEPPDHTEIWRFLKPEYFYDLMANEELYFRRTDLYKKADPDEGLPTDDYLRRTLNLRRYVLDDELELNSHQAENRLFSESQYLCCWNMYDSGNRLRMWYKYAPCGVAIRSEYNRLKAALDTLIDEVSLGKVRYGDEEMTGYNASQILYTKRTRFTWENEVRAVVTCYDPVGGQARYYRETNFPHRESQEDLNPLHPWVHDFKRRRIVLKDLITGIAVSPWASEEAFREIEQAWAKVRGYNLPVAHDLKSPFTPNVEELAERGWGSRGDY